jgi:hypothetical protein
MKTPTRTVVRLALSGGILGTLALAGAPAASASSLPPHDVTFSFSETTTSLDYQDNGDPGPSVGDVVSYTTAIVTATGVQGTKQATCTTKGMLWGSPYAQCAESISLPSGTLKTWGYINQGTLSTGATQYLLVVAGTGSYAGLVGYEDFKATNYPKTFASRVQLRRS